MPTPPKNLDNYFPKVREAREALKAKALALFEKYEAIIDKAIAAGDLEVAATHVQWLIEHMPNEDGERMIDATAAKPKKLETAKTGPSIQIGIALGGMNKPKTLPEVTEITEVDGE